MKRIHWQTIGIFFVSFLWSCLSFAADSGGFSTTDDLMGGISQSDLSVRFLSNIFGVVDGVLHGSGSQIFGAMFGVFNSAVLTLGTSILGYTLFVSTLRTAHEGEALGRNWSSMWIPFKSATGFALMLPKATGYSMIQIFVMWVVVQGVGAANLIWNAALDYLGSGGAIIQPQTPSLTGSVNLASQILKSEVCMFMIEDALDQDQKKVSQNNGTTAALIPSFSQSITSPTTDNQPDYTGDNPKIGFPGVVKNTDGSIYGSVVDPNKGYAGICGNVSWAVAKTPGSKQLADARSLAVVQVITDLIPYAQQIAKDYGPTQTNTQPTSLNTMNQNILHDAGNDYEGIVGPAVNLLQNYRTGAQGAGLNSFVQGAKDDGWIMAGSYYQSVVTLNRNYATDEQSYPTATFTFPTSKLDSLPTGMKGLTSFFQDSSSDLNQYISRQKVDATSNGQGKAFAIASYDLGSGIGGQFVSILTLGLSSIIQGYAELWGNTGLPTTGANNAISVFNPVTSAATLGSGLVSLVASIWIMGAVSVLGIAAVAGIVPCANPMGNAINSFLAWFMPMLSVLMGILFLLGATLAYYIPMVPYILFLFGGIGWLIGVIESMAAAPLVAVGIMYPEGSHEIMGKAEPAVMLLTNIFIRPSLMVIGFIAGISLSYVGVWLLNAGFARAALAMAAGTQGLAWIFMPIAMMSIYTALIVQIINQSFGLIHLLPDEVLRWVGGGGKQFGEAQGEQGVRKAFGEDMAGIGRGAGTTADKAQDRKEKEQAEKDKLGVRPGEKDSGVKTKTD